MKEMFFGTGVRSGLFLLMERS